jgi:Protein of unknown function (DUF2894)
MPRRAPEAVKASRVEPAGAALEACRARLAALEASGARAFDAVSCDGVRTLIGRARALDVRACALLLARADSHMERLAQRFEQTRRQTEQWLAGAEQVQGELPLQRAALARGELGLVRRRLRRLGSQASLLMAADASARAELERARCVAEYEASLAQLGESLALARAVDAVPEQAGPYNPLRIAGDLLARMRSVSPIYLSAQLNRLEELARMFALPELPTKTPVRKGRSGTKAGS